MTDIYGNDTVSDYVYIGIMWVLVYPGIIITAPCWGPVFLAGMMVSLIAKRLGKDSVPW